MTESPIANNAHPNRTRIEFRNAAITAVLVECWTLRPLIARLSDLSLAVKDASPDLAIALWVKFRRLSTETANELRGELATISQQARRAGVAVDPNAMDEIVGTLPTHAELVASIGRYRCQAFISNAIDTAQALHRNGTGIIQHTHTAAVAHDARLKDHLNQLVRQEIAEYTQAVGRPVPAGEVMIELSTSAESPPHLRIDH